MGCIISLETIFPKLARRNEWPDDGMVLLHGSKYNIGIVHSYFSIPRSMVLHSYLSIPWSMILGPAVKKEANNFMISLLKRF